MILQYYGPMVQWDLTKLRVSLVMELEKMQLTGTVSQRQLVPSEDVVEKQSGP